MSSSGHAFDSREPSAAPGLPPPPLATTGVASEAGPAYTFTRGDGPLVAAAIHDGHELRPEVEELLTLDEESRRREEDPLTSLWTSIAASTIRVHRSRFEVDLNRPLETAVYRGPEDAWGLELWRQNPPIDLVMRSQAIHRRFYRDLEVLVGDLVAEHGKIVVFDLHTYNHRRSGPRAPPAPGAGNPEINLGTGTMDRDYWAPVVETFLSSLRDFEFEGRRLDVRENVKFEGGYFPRYLHSRFPDSVCTLSVEVKKFFMDEWTSTADIARVEEIRAALRSTSHPLRRVLAGFAPGHSRREASRQLA